MSNATVTVRASGGDYASLNAALAGESADLTSNCHSTGSAGILTISCGNFADNTQASTGTGYTTSESYYINIVGDPADKTSSNTGIVSTERYRMTYSGGNALIIGERYVSISDIQFLVNPTTAMWCISDTYHGSSDPGIINISNCIFRKTGTQQDVSAIGFDSNFSFTINIRNCIAYNFATTTSFGDAFLATNNANTINIDNCTGYNLHDGIALFSATAVNCRNVGFANCSGTAFPVGVTQTTCSTSTPTFVSTTAGSEDLHLQASDTTWRGQGTDLSATFTTDIDGQTRTGTWDIGADQYISTAVTALPRRALDGPFYGSLRGSVR